MRRESVNEALATVLGAALTGLLAVLAGPSSVLRASAILSVLIMLLFVLHPSARQPQALVDELRAGGALGDGLEVERGIEGACREHHQNAGGHRAGVEGGRNALVERFGVDITDGLPRCGPDVGGFLHRQIVGPRRAKAFGNGPYVRP